MTYHIPVIFQPVTNLIAEHGPRRIIDATIGGAGHARGLLERLPNGSIIFLRFLRFHPGNLSFHSASIVQYAAAIPPSCVRLTEIEKTPSSSAFSLALPFSSR